MDLFAPQHLILILIIILLLFGGRKIPELMRGLGRGVREFNDAKNNVRKEIEESGNVTDKDKDRQQTTSTASNATESSNTRP